MQTTYVVIFVLYCLVSLAIGLWANRKTASMESFLVADRNLGVLPTSMAYYSTAQSSSAFLGSVGWAYAEGWVSNSYTSIPIAFGALLAWMLLAKRVRALVGEAKALTIPDLLSFRFPSKWIRLISLTIIIIAYIPAMIAQIKGCGTLVQSVFPNMDFKYAALVGLTIVCVYVMIGGMKAVAYTDVVQGFLMIGSVIVLVMASLAAVGGFTQMNLQAEAIAPGMTGVMGVDNIWGPGYSLSFALLFLLSPLGQPSYIAKFFAMKSEKVARYAMPLSYTFVFIASVSFPIIGPCARVLHPNLSNPDSAFTVMATSVLPPVMGAVVLVALFAAVMSTMDAMFLNITGAVVRDFYEQLLGKKPSQKFLLRASVITTVITAVVAYVLTLNTTGAIALIGSMSTGLLGASFSVVVVGGLYSKKMTTQAAIAAMLAGFFGTVLTTKGVVLDHLLFGMNAFIYGFIAAIVAAVVVTALTNKDGIDQTISNT